MASWQRQVVPHWADACVAAGLAVLGAYDIWVVAEPQYQGSAMMHTLALLGVTVPLAWLRRAPLAVLAVVTASTVVWELTLTDLTVQPALESGIAVLIAVTVASALVDRASLVLVAGSLAILVAVDCAAMAAGRAPGDTVPAWLIWGIGLVVGRFVHRERTRSERLREHAEQLEQQRVQDNRRAADQERARIARELHDVIAQKLSAMVVQAGVEARVAPNAGETGQVLDQIGRTGRETLVELRRLLGLLRRGNEDLSSEPAPRLADLPGLVGADRADGLSAELQVTGSRRALPAGVEVSAYRIVQEALTNVTKHAPGAAARVTLHYDDEMLDVRIEDDGSAGVSSCEPGFGLIGMRERVALHGGTLEAARRPGEGFVVHAVLPIREGKP